MPCMKCANGKWKYGESGNCVFDTLKACQDAAAAIHIQDTAKKPKKPGGAIDIQVDAPHVPVMPAKATKKPKPAVPVEPVIVPTPMKPVKPVKPGKTK